MPTTSSLAQRRFPLFLPQSTSQTQERPSPEKSSWLGMATGSRRNQRSILQERAQHTLYVFKLTRLNLASLLTETVAQTSTLRFLDAVLIKIESEQDPPPSDKCLYTHKMCPEHKERIRHFPRNLVGSAWDKGLKGQVTLPPEQDCIQPHPPPPIPTCPSAKITKHDP